MGLGQKIIDYIENRQEKKRLNQIGAEGDFWRGGGNNLLFKDLPVETNSVVVDAGAYNGEWTTEMIARYGCCCILFEPLPDNASNLEKLFRNNSMVQVFDLALGSKDAIVPFTMDNDGSTVHQITSSSPTINVKQVDVIKFFDELNLNDIACLKLNVEGAEYDILERLLAMEFIDSCKSILVQFHKQPKGYEERYEGIRQKLNLSHSRQWGYDFVWELWVRN